jgi:glutamate racemase
VRALLPRQDVVYLADQDHVPYGDRSHAELRGFLRDNVAFLEERGVDAIVMGCNTSCAIAARYGWPPARARILDLIDAAADVVAVSGARRVGIVATTATAESGAYGDAIRRRAPAIEVQEIGAPALVPLVEAGILDGPAARDAVAAACARLAGPIDAAVLACTHFPLLDAHFEAVLGDEVLRIDPAVAQADRAAAFVKHRGGERGTGRTLYVTTGELEPFRRAIVATLGPMGPDDAVERIALIST